MTRREFRKTEENGNQRTVPAESAESCADIIADADIAMMEDTDIDAVRTRKGRIKCRDRF